MRLIWDSEGKKYATNDPTPELIEELLEELDNSTHTMVALDLRGLASVIVCGGANDRVRVNYIPENLEQPAKHLIDEDAESDVIDLNMQGKTTTYHMIHTVDRSVALQALVAFIKSPVPSPDLSWMDDV